MVYKGIIEPVLHGGSKLHQIVLIQRKGRDHLIVEHLVHEALDGLIVHAVPDDIFTCQVCAEDKACVGAV